MMTNKNTWILQITDYRQTTMRLGARELHSLFGSVISTVSLGSFFSGVGVGVWGVGLGVGGAGGVGGGGGGHDDDTLQHKLDKEGETSRLCARIHLVLEQVEESHLNYGLLYKVARLSMANDSSNLKPSTSGTLVVSGGIGDNNSIKSTQRCRRMTHTQLE